MAFFPSDESRPRRYFVYAVCGVIVGVFLGIYSRLLPPIPHRLFIVYSVIFLLLLLLPMMFLARFFKIPGDMVLCWILCLSVILGIARVYAFDLIASRTLKQTAGQEHTYSAVLLEPPQESRSGASLGVAVQVVGSDDGQFVSGKVLLYAKPALWRTMTRGDSLRFTATLKESPRASFAGGYDPRLALYRQGISYSVYTTALSPSDTAFSVNTITYRLETLGRKIQDSVFSAVDRTMANHPEESALLKGILIGNRESFTDAQTEAYSDSGLIHITSASGMHIMFLYGFLSYLLRKLRLPNFVIFLAALPILFLFSAAVAFTPSICRAVLMLLLSLIADLLQQEPDSLTSLSFSAFVLILVNPYIITGYSFILSFSSTLGIVLFSAPLTRICKQKISAWSPTARNLLSPVISSVALSASSTLGIGVFTARFFQRLSWGSVFANIPIVPLASVSFIGGFLLWFLYLFSPPLAAFLAGILWIPLWLMNRIADFFSLRFFSLSLPAPSSVFIAGYLLLLCVIHETFTNQKR